MQEISSLKETKPSILKLNRFDYRPFAAFFATLAFYLILAIICRKYPFGTFSTSISDLAAQYAPFLSMYRNRMDLVPDANNFLSSLMYSFDLGLGGNYMSTFGYYLASPLNLLFRFFDSSFIEGFVLILMILKMSFASAFMCMFMGIRAKDKNSWYPVLFGILYAFSSYATAFLFSIMWLDGYMLLPLILYFTEVFILKDKKAGLIFSLLVLFLSNYYIAYMVGIYSFLYLLVRMFYLGQFKEIKKGIKKIVRFILIAVFDAMMLCVMLIPVGLNTLTNADPTSSSNKSHFVTYNLKEILDHLFLGMDGDFGDVMPSNLPWFFVSTLITFLIVLFFVSKTTKTFDKILYGLCIVGVYLSTAVIFFDVAWQVFDSPNWFWHRHSFVFIPLFMIIASKVYEQLKNVTRKELLISAVILIGLLFISQASGGMKDDKIFLFNLGMLVSVFVLLFLINKPTWSKDFEDMPQIMPFLLGVIICFEVVYLQPLASNNISTMTLFTGRADQYKESIIAMQDLADVQVLTAQQNHAFRAENETISDYGKTNYLQEHPNMFGGFHGTTFFNSSSNKSLHRFLKQLGYQVNYNYFAMSYSYTAPDSDAFLSIGAMTTMREYSDSVYIADDQFGIGYHFYANKNVLPLAFAADGKAADFDFYQLEKMTTDKNYFAFRNLWFKSLFPEQFTEDYFITVPDEYVAEPVVTNGMMINDDLTTMTEILRKDMTSEELEAVGEEDSSAKNKDSLGLEDNASEEAGKNAVKYYRTNKDLPIYVEFKMTAPVDGEFYFNLSVPHTYNEFLLYVNNIQISHASEGTFFSEIFRLGTFKAGDEVTVTVKADAKSFTYLSYDFGYVDFAKFDSQFGGIDRSKVTVNEAVDGYVNLTSNIADGDMVITTVPYEKGWTLLIDGKETEIIPYQNAFIAFDVPSGTHTCELKFIAPGFKAGAAVSCVGLLGMIAFVIVDRKKKKENA